MKCPECGKAELKAAQVPLSIVMAGTELVSEVPGRRCSKCKFSTVSGEAGARFELLVAAELVKRGLRSGASFKFLRKTLGMKATELARVMNVAAETVSRWETGQREVDWPEFLLLGCLVDDKLAGRTTVLARAAALAAPREERRIRLRFQAA
jgi:putative zinc finger/helix-turn-helix YgiT family protein